MKEIRDNKQSSVDFTLNDTIEIVFNKDEDFKKVQITISDFLEKFTEDLYVILEEQENPCTCNINESTPYCECGCYFDDYKIVGFNIIKNE